MAKKPSKPQVAESPIADVFESRHPSAAEKNWAEKTLAPTLEKAPERPLGPPHRRESRRARPRALHHDFRRADSPPLHASRSAGGLKRRAACRLFRPTALHARHSRHGISRQALHHAAVLRLRFARRDQPALQIFTGTRRQRTIGGF